ncbi:conserved hypothetical protein [Idiomarinaceae bacterium HL-53]|nr:conserved hypothetical protein [Idiomarinaceae bacterium HL-53]
MSFINEGRFVMPDWQVPKSVNAVITTRRGGVSAPPYDALNVGTHVGDLALAVRENRRLVTATLSLPSEPHWLAQVHSARVVEPGQFDSQDPPEADAIYTCIPRQVLAIMTADCLPLLLANSEGTEIAAAHCGWRGGAAGIVEQTLSKFKAPREQIHAYLGPAIGPNAFEVGDDVRSAMLLLNKNLASCFTPFAAKWLLDIYALVTTELSRLGVTSVAGGNFCTVSEPERFFSYRRDGITGRMASLIWIK